jgi:DNA repair exonuclease SbcCD ATPase subunit
MTPKEIAAIKKRLEQSITSLEEQTITLKNDLKALNDFLEKKDDLTPDISQKISEQEAATRKQVAANQALLHDLGKIETETNTSPEIISELEKRTLAMLHRMQQKVSAKEIISDLYEEMGQAPPAPEIKQGPKKVADSIEEAKKIRTEQEMEQTVKKIKDKEALDELKKKLGMG